MKNYLMKCEKWYSQTMAIFSENIRTGSLMPPRYNSNFKVSFNGKEFVTRKRNMFSNNFSVHSGISKMADVNCRSISNNCVITTPDGKQYFLNCNFWGNRYLLSGQEGQLGECQQKTLSSTFSFDDRVDDSLIVAIMTHTYRVNQTAIWVACFVPIFVVLLTSLN